MTAERRSDRIWRGFRRLLHIVARPAKVDRGAEGLVIHPFRGYGSRDEIFLMGRVFRQTEVGSGVREGTVSRDMIDSVRRLLRRGVRGARITARIAGAEQTVESDRDGYFRFCLHPEKPLVSDRLWHRVSLEYSEGEGRPIRASGEFFTPPDEATCVIISDIDDTVMFTGVVNKARMIWRLFVEGAEKREAFPGVGAFYRALHHGASGRELNPILYVSRGPWSIYEMLDKFFNLHNIPVGPILFLREWGIRLRRPLPRKAPEHKHELIRKMLSLYHEYPFILIGDSGQHDPEIYSEIIREFPGRVAAVYIRNVSRKKERIRAIENLATEMAEEGSSLLLATDTFAMADHAAKHGLLSSEGLKDVVRERTEQKDEQPTPKRTKQVEGSTAEQEKEAVRRGDLGRALREGDGAEPPNVSVESEGEKCQGPACRLGSRSREPGVRSKESVSSEQ